MAALLQKFIHVRQNLNSINVHITKYFSCFKFFFKQLKTVKTFSPGDGPDLLPEVRCADP